MTDFETCPVGTVKNLEAEIERMRVELDVIRLQRDAKLLDEAAAREIDRHRARQLVGGVKEIPTRDRIIALLSPPSQDVWLTVDDARWIKAEIEDLNRVITDERTAKIAWRSISANQEIEIERLRKIIENLRKGNEEAKI